MGRRAGRTSRGPTIGQALAMFAAIALVLIVLIWSPVFATTDSGRDGQGSLCDAHRGQPAWESVCREAERR